MAESLFNSKVRYGIQLLGQARTKNEDVQNEDFLCIQKVQNKLVRFLNQVSLKDHQSTESLLEKSNMLSVNRINAQTKLTEVWKALHKDQKPNNFKNSVPQINEEERQLRSKSKGLLTITGHTTVTRNSFINDGKILWNQCPEEIMQSKTLHPPKTLIKKFVKTLPL